MKTEFDSTARFSKLAIASLCFTAPWYFYMHLHAVLWQWAGGTPDDHNIWVVMMVTAILIYGMLIAGIVGGHVAASHIKKSGGALRGEWLARLAYILGYVWLLFCAIWGIMALLKLHS